MNVPVMYQGGTLDVGITLTARRDGGAYSRSSTPRYYVELEGAGHFAWTELNKTLQGVISRYAVAFFDRYLKGKSDPDPLAALMRAPLPERVSYVMRDEK